MRQPWGALAIALLSPALALAGGKITISETQSVSIGGGIRTSLNFVEDAAPSGEEFGKDFQLNSARIYLGGQVAKGISTELNADINPDTVQVLDAVVKFEYSEKFGIWVGRFLPPSDRANLSGPYYTPVWDYPFTSALGFPIFAGRDDGIAVWGQFKGGKFKYQVGAFQGAENPSDNAFFSGRVVANLRDPEPGYYNSSTYWGGKKIFAIGVTAQAQADGAGRGKDYAGFEVDVLFEQPTSSGVFTLDGAFYSFGFNDEANPSQGGAFYVWGGYLINKKVGVGQFQPLVRFQSFSPDAPGSESKDRLDVQLNYIIDKDNARVHFVYAKNSGAVEGSEIKLGVQVQF